MDNDSGRLNLCQKAFDIIQELMLYDDHDVKVMKKPIAHYAKAYISERNDAIECECNRIAKNATNVINKAKTPKDRIGPANRALAKIEDLLGTHGFGEGALKARNQLEGFIEQAEEDLSKAK